MTMDRRSFIKTGAGVVGGLVTGLADAQVKPCPPPSISVDSGSAVSTSCNIGTAADWQSRISGPGVVWYHDFETAAEVNAFRWSPGYQGGNDPNDVSQPNRTRWVAGDGFAGGGCLELWRTTGSGDGPDWWRPLSPLSAPGNGKSDERSRGKRYVDRPQLECDERRLADQHASVRALRQYGLRVRRQLRRQRVLLPGPREVRLAAARLEQPRRRQDVLLHALRDERAGSGDHYRKP